MNRKVRLENLLPKVVIFFVFLFSQGLGFSQDPLVKNKNTVSINILGKERVLGIFPNFENKALCYKAVKVGKENIQLEDGFVEKKVSYSISKKNKPVVITSRFYNKTNVIGFFLSPQNNHSAKGEDYVGIFLDSIPNFDKGITYYRNAPWKNWTIPYQVTYPSKAEKQEIQFFIWQYSDGVYGAMIPLGGNGYRATLGSENKDFGAKAECLVDGFSAENIPVMAMGFSNDPYKLVEDVYDAGMKMMEKSGMRKHKTYPKVFENFGWCSWNAFEMEVSTEKILKTAKSFTDSSFALPFVLVDDGWMQTGSDKKLKSFLPSEEKFPGGFKNLVQTLKDSNHVKNVGVWHTMNAYWKGVDPKSELGKKYEFALGEYLETFPYWLDDPKKPELLIAPSAATNSGMKFFDDWYASLKENGISFVKCDNQLVVERIAKDRVPLWKASENMQKNFQQPAKKHFNGAIINCMDMNIEAPYNFGSSSVARVVEDYLPDNKKSASNHVYSALANSLYFSQMVWPDLDMFQSYDTVAQFHAIARAISGGPVYITDEPGKQKFEIIRPFTLSNGQLLRADIPVRPTKDCLLQSIKEPKPYKAFSLSNGAGLLGAWNVSESKKVEGFISSDDIYGIKGDKFLIYDYYSKEAKVVKRGDRIPVSIPHLQSKLFIIVPIERETAVIGLINKYNSPKTILSQINNEGEIEIKVAEGGTLGVHLPAKAREILVDGVSQNKDSFKHEGELLFVKIDTKKKSERIVKIFF